MKQAIQLINKANAIYDQSLRGMVILASVMLSFTVILVCADVIGRYGFTRPLLWAPEITTYILVWVTFLGTAWVLGQDKHIKMDLVITNLKPRAQAMLNIITSILGAMSCLILAVFGTKVTYDVAKAGLFYYSYLEPPKFIMLIPVALGCALLFIQFSRRAHGYIRDWKELSEKPKITTEEELAL